MSLEYLKQISDMEDEYDFENCPICLEPMKPNHHITPVCKSGCNHHVHTSCWRMYLINVPQSRHSCPTCRNNNVQWPNDELKRIAVQYGNPVDDIIEKGPSWWIELSTDYINEWYLHEDELIDDFTTRMENSLHQALEQGAVDPDSDLESDDDMPELVSDDDMPELVSDDEMPELEDLSPNETIILRGLFGEVDVVDRNELNTMIIEQNETVQISQIRDRVERELLQQFELENN